MMGVPEKCDFSGGIQQPIESLRGCEYVFIFILKRAVYQNDSVSGERSMGKRGKPGEILGIQLRASPIDCGFRDGIEVGSVHESGDGFVVIASNSLRAKFAKAGDHIVRIGPIADDIAETHGNIPAAVRGVKSSGEGCGVCVKIAENQNAHSCHPQNALEYR